MKRYTKTLKKPHNFYYEKGNVFNESAHFENVLPGRNNIN